MARTTSIIPSAAPILGLVPTTHLLRRRSATIRPSAMTTGGEETGTAATSPPYPTPLSPPHPPHSRSIELRRAMSAASRSALFSLTDDQILFEDEFLAVVNKPAGIYCEALLSSFSTKSSPNLPELHLANRLDRDTSGLMIITKSHKTAATLVKAFTDHRVKKTYLALCTGKKPNWGRMTIKSGHGRSRFGAWRVYAAADVGRVLPGGSVVKEMGTFFELVAVGGRPERGLAEERVVAEEVKAAAEEEMEKGEEILVKCMPETGRTHQIRLHCQYLGMPIKGDVKYGGVREWEGEESEFHALHAESLVFEHPFTGLPLRFQSPLPAWARGII